MASRVWRVPVVCLGIMACGGVPAAREIARDSVLREGLLRRGAADQAVRAELVAALRRGEEPGSTAVAAISQTDSANTAWLREVVGQWGWPSRARVGEEAAAAAFLIVQHASDTSFQRAMLAALQQAFEAGEVEGQQLALLIDRVEVAAGRPQRYGTQARLRDGRVVLEPITDSAQVDARRAALGLIPLVEYVRVLDSVYTAAGAGSGAPPSSTR